MSLLRTEHLGIRIGSRHLCEDLNLSVETGQCWAILGPNGSGKTTLLHTLAHLRPPDAGSIRLDNQMSDSIPRKQLARRLGLMPQDNSDPFPMLARDAVMLGRYPHLSGWQWEGREDRDQVDRILETLGLNSLADQNVQTLSGGERRRLAFATLLVQDPALLLLDEPTNHLDLHQQINVLGRVRKATQAQDKAAMLVLHDINLAARYCDHCLMLMPDGSSLQGRVDELFSEEILSRLYGWPMRAVAVDAGQVWVPAL